MRNEPPAITSTGLTHKVAFVRAELGHILNLYGRMVAAGYWRDYAIDALADRAVFSIYRHASEAPLYRIEKIPAQARRQGMYCVISMEGRILKRGGDLDLVLKALDKKRFNLVD